VPDSRRLGPGPSLCECPTAGAFGSACGPAPLVAHGPTVPGRWRSPETFVPWEGMLLSVPSRVSLAGIEGAIHRTIKVAEDRERRRYQVAFPVGPTPPLAKAFVAATRW